MIRLDQIYLEEGWKKILSRELEQEYMVNLEQFLREESARHKTIYPRPNEIFNALNFTPFHKVKVVLLGQDPYSGPNQAHGLSFSVRPPVPPPPSLRNIFVELQADLNIPISKHGSLISWATQGVLLLNAILTVEKGKPLSHKNKGWETFTDRIIEILAQEKKNLVYLLWGKPAQKKRMKVNDRKNLILTAPHPSPLAAARGFFGCRHFSKTNHYLLKNGIKPINWKLPPDPLPLFETHIY